MLKKIVQAAIFSGLLLILSSCLTNSNLMLMDIPEDNVDEYAQIRVIENHLISIIAIDGKELEKDAYKVGVAPGKHEITVLFGGGSYHAAMTFAKTRRFFRKETRTIPIEAQAGRSYFIQYLSISYYDPDTFLDAANLLTWFDSNNYVSRLGEARKIKYTEDKKTITGTYTVNVGRFFVLNYLSNELLLQQSKGALIPNWMISPEIFRPKGNSFYILHPNYGLAPEQITENLSFDTGLGTSGKPVFTHYIDATIAGSISVLETTPGISTVTLVLFKDSRKPYMDFAKYVFERMQY